jgi:hypothetical protein
VSMPLLLLIDHSLRRSAPRSGARRKFPVGSVTTWCGWGASCLDGIVPDPDMVNLNDCSGDEDDDKGSANVDTVDD